MLDILNHMEVTALELEKFRADNEAEAKKEAAQEAAVAAQLRSDPQEQEAFEALLLEAQCWQQFQVLDKYLDELGKHYPRTPAFQQWLNWARERRRVFDPAQKRREEFDLG